jgi:hypothetical protein
MSGLVAPPSVVFRGSLVLRLGGVVTVGGRWGRRLGGGDEETEPNHDQRRHGGQKLQTVSKLGINNGPQLRKARKNLPPQASPIQ